MRNEKYVWPTTLAPVLLLNACGSAGGTKGHADGNQTKSVNEVFTSRQQAAESQKTASASSEAVDVTATSRVAGESSEAPVDLKDADGTDLDLTKLNTTMAFLEVYNTVVDPDSYMGKIIRMRGLVTICRGETKDMDYYSCIVQDATACCTQGTEFKLADSYRFPDDYPPEGSEITVHGRFDVYKEGEYKYVVLKGAVLEKVNIENKDETTAP